MAEDGLQLLCFSMSELSAGEERLDICLNAFLERLCSNPNIAITQSSLDAVVELLHKNVGLLARRPCSSGYDDDALIVKLVIFSCEILVDRQMFPQNLPELIPNVICMRCGTILSSWQPCLPVIIGSTVL